MTAPTTTLKGLTDEADFQVRSYHHLPLPHPSFAGHRSRPLCDMRATRIKGAVSCQLCTEILDPEDNTLDDVVEATWKCPDCEAVIDTAWTAIEQLACSHDPPEVLREQCPECEAWVEPQEYVDRKQCPSCQDWFEAGGDMEYEETEAWKCGECDTVYGDRDEAKECCRD